MWTYTRCLPVWNKPGTKLLIKTITDLVEIAYVLVRAKARIRETRGISMRLRGRRWNTWV
ncbi:hypothetical protein F5882DRAFT_311517 [Hyaloscypha sp. PMI_1271]|nr:hypothetical protein F5882DRAFT_311517 [Hyaloscypha sp. PMI_1271]